MSLVGNKSLQLESNYTDDDDDDYNSDMCAGMQKIYW